MMNSTNVFIELNRIRLRDFVKSDARLMTELHKDRRVTQALVEGAVLSNPRRTEHFVNQTIESYKIYPGVGSWVAEKKDKENQWNFQGWFNLSPIPRSTISPTEYGRHKSALEIGSRLSPSAWGTATAVQLGCALLDYAFYQYKAAPYVLIHCLPYNRSAIYVALYLGFQHSGPIRYFNRASIQFKLTPAHYQTWCRLPRRERRRRALSGTQDIATRNVEHPTI